MSFQQNSQWHLQSYTGISPNLNGAYTPEILSVIYQWQVASMRAGYQCRVNSAVHTALCSDSFFEPLNAKFIVGLSSVKYLLVTPDAN